MVFTIHVRALRISIVRSTGLTPPKGADRASPRFDTIHPSSQEDGCAGRSRRMMWRALAQFQRNPLYVAHPCAFIDGHIALQAPRADRLPCR